MEIKNFSHSSSFLVLFNVVVEPAGEIRRKRDRERKFQLTNREKKNLILGDRRGARRCTAERQREESVE